MYGASAPYIDAEAGTVIDEKDAEHEREQRKYN